MHIHDERNYTHLPLKSKLMVCRMAGHQYGFVNWGDGDIRVDLIVTAIAYRRAAGWFVFEGIDCPDTPRRERDGAAWAPYF